MRPAVTVLACFLAALLFASDGNTVLLADLGDHAMQQSQITLPGSKVGLKQTGHRKMPSL
jgi:hypothetical protein